MHLCCIAACAWSPIKMMAVWSLIISKCLTVCLAEAIRAGNRPIHDIRGKYNPLMSLVFCTLYCVVDSR